VTAVLVTSIAPSTWRHDAHLSTTPAAQQALNARRRHPVTLTRNHSSHTEPDKSYCVPALQQSQSVPKKILAGRAEVRSNTGAYRTDAQFEAAMISARRARELDAAAAVSSLPVARRKQMIVGWKTEPLIVAVAFCDGRMVSMWPWVPRVWDWDAVIGGTISWRGFRRVSAGFLRVTRARFTNK